MILGNAFFSICFICWSLKNDCPNGYSTAGLYTLLYIILASVLERNDDAIHVDSCWALSNVISNCVLLAPAGAL